MNRFFVLLTVVSLSAAALAAEVAKPVATTKQNGKAPLMVAFADLKWTELPERKGMQFAVLSGDPKGRIYADAQGAGRNGQPPSLAQQ